MIFDVSAQFEELIKNAIKKQIDTLPISYPCKVKSVKDDGVFVEVEVMLPQEKSDTPTIIPIMQSPYLTLPIKENDLGIALNCTYLFQDMVEDKKIEEAQKSIKENGLFFIPILSKSGFKGEVGKTTLSSQDHTSSINLSEKQIELKAGDTTNAQFGDKSIELKATQQTGLIMGSDVSLQSGSTVEIKGVTASLGEILGDLITALNTLSLTQSTAPGSPVTLPPNFLTDLTAIQTKITGNLK